MIIFAVFLLGLSLHLLTCRMSKDHIFIHSAIKRAVGNRRYKPFVQQMDVPKIVCFSELKRLLVLFLMLGILMDQILLYILSHFLLILTHWSLFSIQMRKFQDNNDVLDV